MKIKLLSLFCVFCFSVWQTQLKAENILPKQEKNIGNWITHIETKGKQKICYVYSHPVKSQIFEGNVNNRKEPYINVNYLGNKKYTITVNPGFKIFQKKPILIITDGNIKNSLNIIDQDYAVTFSSEQDYNLINKFIKSTDRFIKIKSYESADIMTLDYYSLAGFKEALQYLTNNC